MKAHAFGYLVAMVILLVTGAGCRKKSTPDPQSSTGQGSATIKLTQNGQVVTEFNTTKTSGLGGDTYSVIISSPDDKHTLTLDIIGQSTGTYPFTPDPQTLTIGKANFLYQSYALPEVYAGTVGILEPTSGEVVVSTATKTRCSGSFTGRGKNAKDGKSYLLEGTFDTPVLN
ncbi:MAG: hypothetical protein JWP57_217 [Spirosoma sp.]|nr:hypothetical protein [Spirosoma sp.]